MMRLLIECDKAALSAHIQPNTGKLVGRRFKVQMDNERSSFSKQRRGIVFNEQVGQQISTQQNKLCRNLQTSNKQVFQTSGRACSAAVDFHGATCPCLRPVVLPIIHTEATEMRRLSGRSRIRILWGSSVTGLFTTFVQTTKHFSSKKRKKKCFGPCARPIRC